MSSNWLDRLWSSKGFSSTTHIDLDPLKTNAHSSISTPIRLQNPQLPPVAMDANNNQPSDDAFTRITNALSDLFCVGDPIPKSSFPGARKFPRKQPNPLHYVASKPSDSSHIHTDSTGGDHINNGLGLLKELTVEDDEMKLAENSYSTQEEEDADKGGSPSLDGFSRTEITVIDTSFADWKSEKYLFRKNGTWKVRDKKGGNKGTLALRRKNKRKAQVMKRKDKKEGKKLKILHQGSSSMLGMK